MDLDQVEAVACPAGSGDLETLMATWSAGDVWLAGGTWLFSEPQPSARRLIDLTALGWEPVRITEAGLSIAATCTISTLAGLSLPAAWRGAALIGQCCDAFLASFKVWAAATVGGNLCSALPAGPMISLCVALDGVCTLLGPHGERQVAALDFVRGPQETALRPGEVLRAIDLPAAALRRRTALQRISLTPHGRSAALLIGTLSEAGDLALTVTASTRRPVALAFVGLPSAQALRDRLASAIPEALYYDDIHGRPDWRRHMTFDLAEAIRRDLCGEAA